jgi:hypothetical protein
LKKLEPDLLLSSSGKPIAQSSSPSTSFSLIDIPSLMEPF